MFSKARLSNLKPKLPFGRLSFKNFHRTRYLNKEVEIFVNDKPIKVDSSYTIFQACHEAGEVIPRFCYHEKLSVAGSCRMCLVEVEKSPKPIAACAMPVMAGMRINTKSEKTKIARGGVMEFLLANHPLDCPICDQGGECDLQDISEVYGFRSGRNYEWRRGVEDKDFGPLVKTTMTRCIHCTRCIRFSEEVAGEFRIGTTGRGKATEISTYIEHVLTHELSANIVDLCPVGALTNLPYAFKARPWELKQIPSIDVFEPIIPSIQIDIRGAEVMRVLPRINEEVNEEWISDKSRFAFDGIKRQRLNVPMERKSDGQFVDLTWEDALEKAAQVLSSTQNIGVLIGDQADCESITAIRDLMHQNGVENLEFRSDNLKIDNSFRNGYLMNSRIRGVEDADLLLLIGTNPKVESPVFNARIRKAVVKNNLQVGLVGSPYDLTYEYDHLGVSPKTLIDLLDGKHPFSSKISNSKLPMMIVGSSVFTRVDGFDLYKLCLRLAKKFYLKDKFWNGFNVLHKEVGNIGALDLGIQLNNTKKSKPKVVFLLGCDEFRNEDIPEDAYVIYQGTHGDRGAERANLILPGATYVEKAATFVSTTGRVDVSRVSGTLPYLAREDWQIIRALSEFMGTPLPYDEIHEVRNRMCELAPFLVKYDHLEPSGFEDLVMKTYENDDITVNNTNLVDTIDNFYMTNNISRASPTMAKCSHQLNKKRLKNFISPFVN